MTAIETGEQPTADGFTHELGLYGSDDEFRELIYPFALEGLENDEPLVFAYDQHKVELLKRWLPDAPGVVFITDTTPYATPARALAGWRTTVLHYLASGARRVRIAGNVPHPGYGQSYVGWDRYEAAVDRALGDLPVWAPCLYDTRIAPPEVLEIALRYHHHIFDSSGHRSNGDFQPTRRLGDFLSPPSEPVEETVPDFDLIDPTAAAVRQAIRRLTAPCVSPSGLDDLLLASTEAVTNASQHGSAPVRVNGWMRDGRVVIKVHDCGRGPADPLAGLVPSVSSADDESGRGMWLTHQLEVEVSLDAGNEGFSVRISSDLDL